MSYEDLILEKKEDGIAILTLNVPEKLNAMTVKMRENLPLAVDDVAKDGKVRVLVVTGAGRGFCAGADVTSMGREHEPRYQRIEALGWPFADAFCKMNKPVIAAINGACVGGGLSLALNTDIRIASTNSKFGVAQTQRALAPDYGLTFLLPKIVGLSKALEIMMTGELFGAEEAERIGLVSKVVALEELMDTTLDLAGRIAKQAPLAVEFTKRTVWRGMMDDYQRQLDLESFAQSVCGFSEDHRENIRAFLEKRPMPKYKGR